MSAPDTDVEKQAKRHAGPIVGITVGVVFVAVLLLVYVFYIATPAEDAPDITPAGEEAITDGNASIQPEDAESEPGAPALPDAGTDPAPAPTSGLREESDTPADNR